MTKAPILIVLTPAAMPVAIRLRDHLPGALLHGLEGRTLAADTVFSDTGAHLRRLFADGHPLIGLCAAGILIRALAPVLGDKTTEPPVLAIAPDGQAVVPLLGGHHGANALARDLAAFLGTEAAVTTAGDTVFGLALDEPPPGWRVVNPERVKPVAAALLAGDPVRLEIEAGDADWLAGLPTADDAAQTVRVGDRVPDQDGALHLAPPILALGVGCERGAAPAELADLARSVLAEAGLSPAAVACVASIDLKADEAAVQALATALGVPARFFTAAELEEQAPRLIRPSAVVFRETGCHGVAEGAALAAAGADGILVVPKTRSARCTVALARAPHAIAADQVGRARGRLFVVGICPGAHAWRTPEADAAIAAATDLVGYGLYLDLLGAAAEGKIRHQTGLGAETERARRALDLAAEGRTVALVCSGDAGIYALATLVFELMDREDRPDWRRLDIAVMPGVSAMQAAASRAGAPLNHDFCTISLSDLLTPWATIERRLEAAAAGDFVVCFYNPVSERRRDHLARARDILLTGRPGTTPVVLGRNLGREGERVEIVPLAELTPDHADMLTLVMVGNSETRSVDTPTRRWVYTPRGYAGKSP